MKRPGNAPFACRFCGRPLMRTVVDLGTSPLANSYLKATELSAAETHYPLRVLVCDSCWLVQLPAFAPPEAIFSDYAYFSSYSETWLAHSRQLAHGAIERLGLDGDSLVVEVASNDGYLLRFFRQQGVPVLGIEPAANVAAAAERAGIPTLARFFGSELADELVADGRRADLLVGNNVLAHVPDLNDFVAGLAALLAPSGVLVLEFPHLLRLIDECQFDTIYHEHFSYFSFATARDVLARHGLAVFDVEELPTHGGSLRLWAARKGERPKGEAVAALLAQEEEAGLRKLATYGSFAGRVVSAKHGLLRFLLDCQRHGREVVGYGAPAKGNTLLNYCGVRADLLPYTVDLSPHKQGRFLPGSRIPVHEPDRIRENRPDFVLILPWNLAPEITRQMADVRSWGGRFVVAIPEVRVLE